MHRPLVATQLTRQTFKNNLEINADDLIEKVLSYQKTEISYCSNLKKIWNNSR